MGNAARRGRRGALCMRGGQGMGACRTWQCTRAAAMKLKRSKVWCGKAVPPCRSVARQYPPCCEKCVEGVPPCNNHGLGLQRAHRACSTPCSSSMMCTPSPRRQAVGPPPWPAPLRQRCILPITACAGLDYVGESHRVDTGSPGAAETSAHVVQRHACVVAGGVQCAMCNVLWWAVVQDSRT